MQRIQIKNENNQSREFLDYLFEGWLKPLHSNNARNIFKILLNYKDFTYITTHDIEIKLNEINFNINKKEINAWLNALNEASLVEKDQERGKPTIVEYSGKYSYDRWRITKIGLRVGNDLQYLLNNENIKPEATLPKLIDLNENSIEDLEDLYYTAKLLIILYKSGGRNNYRTLRKTLNISKEKLAIYSWPDSTHSDKPLFEISVKPLSFRGKIFKLFRTISEEDLEFTLSETGKIMAEHILST